MIIPANLNVAFWLLLDYCKMHPGIIKTETDLF